MPFTPFHMGPALALKSVAGDRFSILVFGLAQVAIDIEPLIGHLRRTEVHGWTHTYLGATLIGALVLVLGRPIALVILKRWNGELRRFRLDWLACPDEIAWLPAAFGAFIGTYSHIVLDSVMHDDLRPLAPFSNANGLLDAVSVPALYLGCTVAGVVGTLIWVARQRAERGMITSLRKPP